MKRRFLLLLLVACGCVALTLPADAYLKFGIDLGPRTIVLRWGSQPVRYFVSDRLSVPGVNLTQFEAALTRAFATWEAVGTSAIRFQRVGVTGARPIEDDGLTTLGFESRPELERVLGQTSFTVDETTGTIVEVDVFFNATFPWSVAEAGEAGRFDLESIAVHEIGHLVGLGHSAIGETELQPGGGRRVIGAKAVMFPIAFGPRNIVGRQLQTDDIAGVSDIYPDGDFNRRTGSISGRVTKNGQGFFGAHIVAYNLRTRQLVGNFTLNERGEYVIAGVDPGPCLVRVEPLDDGDIESFFDDSIDVDLDFQVTYRDRLAVVPEGGNVGDVDVAVRPK